MSELYIGGQQILPEEPEVVTGYTVNTTYIPSSSSNKINVNKVGRVVQIECDLAGGVNLPAAMQNIIISGLPKPIGNILELQCTIDIPANYIRVWVNAAGNLISYTNPAYTGNLFVGGTYVTSD